MGGWQNAGGWQGGGWGRVASGGGGGGYANSETTAWVSAVTANGGSVSTNGNYVDTLITSLKSNTLFTLLDRLWIHSLAGENSIQGLVSIVKAGAPVPADATVACTISGTGTYTLDANGWTNGASQTRYLNTGYNPSTSTLIGQNDNSFLQYILNNRTIGDTTISLGSYDGTNVHQYLPNYSVPGTKSFFPNGATEVDATGLGTSKGNFGWMRVNSTTVAAVYDEAAATLSTTASTSQPFSNQNLFIGARNNTGTPDSYNTDNIAVTGVGRTLTQTQMINLQHAVNVLMTSLGKNTY